MKLKTRIRVVERGEPPYLWRVQSKKWWWPFWQTMQGYNVDSDAYDLEFTSFEIAMNYKDKLAEQILPVKKQPWRTRIVWSYDQEGNEVD